MSEAHVPDGPVALALKNFAAGAVGGTAQCVTGHPLDTVKVRLQTQTDGKYKGMVDAFRTMAKEEGPLSVYKGVQSPLIAFTLQNATLFFVNGAIKDAIGLPESQLQLKHYFASGALAGIAMACIEGPADLAKSQLQINYTKYTGLLDCFKKIVRQNGLRGPLQGFPATIVRNIPANSCYFGFYEGTKMLMRAPGEEKHMPAWKLIVAGSVGGVMYWLPIFPIDVIKSTMQSDTIIRSERTYTTFVRTAQLIFKKEGIRGFSKGIVPCMVRSAPANAACFLGYEQARKFLG